MLTEKLTYYVTQYYTKNFLHKQYANLLNLQLYWRQLKIINKQTTRLHA